MGDNIKEIILNTLPESLTDAIYIFGSYNTEYFDQNTSDIDIAWFSKDEVDYSKLISYEYELSEKLGREVDLVIPDKNNIYFLKEVLSNTPLIIYSDKFIDWLDKFNDWVVDEYKFLQNVIDERCDKYE